MSVEVLVTGAATHLGGNAVRTLALAGRSVRAQVGPQEPTWGLEGLEGVQIVRGDVSSRSEAQRLVRGARFVLHCAVEARLWSRLEGASRRVALLGTERICDAARQAGVERLVHVGAPEGGASEVSRRCVDAALDAELLVRQQLDAGLDAVIVLPTVMFGPWDVRPTSSRLIQAVAQRRILGYPRGGNNFVDVRDAARAAIAALNHGERGQRYLLGGENLAWREVFALIAEIVHAPPPRLAVPRRLAMAASAMSEAWGGLTGRAPTLSAAEVDLAYMVRSYGSQDADDALGMAHTPLRQTLEDAWEWMRSDQRAAARM